MSVAKLFFVGVLLVVTQLMQVYGEDFRVMYRPILTVSTSTTGLRFLIAS